MPLHVAARLHAFAHGFFRPSDEQETRDLHDRVTRQFEFLGLTNAADRDRLIASLAADVMALFGVYEGDRQAAVIGRLTRELFDYETLFKLPDIDWSERRSVAQYWDIRDQLNAQRRLVEDFDGTLAWLRESLASLLAPIYASCRALLDADEDTEGISVPTELLRSLGDLGAVTPSHDGRGLVR